MADEQQFDVFLAHNSKDKPQVRAIAQELKQQGLKPWIDEDQIRPGDPIPTKVQEGISQSRNFAFFVGLEGFGKFQGFWELDALIMLSAKNNLRIIPVLLPGVKDLPKDQPFFASRRYLQFHQSVDETEPLKELIQTIRNETVSDFVLLPQQISEKEIISNFSKPASNPHAVRQQIITKSSNIFSIIFAEEESAGVDKLLKAIKSILGVRTYNWFCSEVSEKRYREYTEKLISRGFLNEFLRDLINNKDYEDLGYSNLGTDIQEEIKTNQTEVYRLLILLKDLTRK